MATHPDEARRRWQEAKEHMNRMIAAFDEAPSDQTEAAVKNAVDRYVGATQDRLASKKAAGRASPASGTS